MKNYLQIVFDQASSGNFAPVNRLSWIIGTEQKRLSRVLEQHGFWYVDIPRTSSTFIQVNLGQTFGYPHGKNNVPGEGVIRGTDSFLLPAHTPAFLVRDLVGQDLWATMRTFSVIRDPLAWAISLWRYTHEYDPMDFGHLDFSAFLREFAKRLLVPVRQRAVLPSCYTQADYLLDPENGDRLVDTVLKFEDREAIESYLNDLGHCDPAVQSPLVQSTAGAYQASEEDRDFVCKVFARDIALYQSI